MKLHRTLTTLFALAAPALPAAADNLTFTNEVGTKTTFYGQVNLAFQGVDDGVDDYTDFVDNANSTSRLGLWIDGNYGETRLRFNFETGLGILSTSKVSQTGDPTWISWQRTDIRKFEVVASGDFGAIWVGQGSMATDGVAEIDSSGTSLAGYSNQADIAGGFLFRDGEDLSDVSVGGVFRNFDGSRRFRVRYDTPDFSGFVISAAVGEEILAEGDDALYYDASVRYGYEDDTFELNAGLGYAVKDDDGSKTEQVIASASGLHVPTGLNLTLATGEQMENRGNYFYAKFGWKGEFIPAGSTAVSIDYYDGSDFGEIGSASSAWGVQAVQQFADLGLEAYLGYRVFEYDQDTATEFEDVSAVLFGARWRF